MTLFDVYPLFDINIVKGRGCSVWDDKGQEYLDLYGGHAVISIGHCHPHYVEKLTEQFNALGFYSNSVVNTLQRQLAERLGKACGYDDYQLFLINSGAEANENALKLASFKTGRTRVLSASKAFHGRTSLAVEATEIYDDESLTEYFDDDTLDLINRGINPIKFKGLKLAITSDDSKAINEDPRPKIILSASGMCEAGRIRHHLKHNLWRKECTIMFVGYQADGTLGRKILEGAKSVTLFGEEVQVNAKIEKMEGISGHADRDMLLAWLSAMPEKPKVVFVNHGHDTVCDEFAKTIELKLDTPALAPYSGDGFELGDTVRQVDVGPRKLYNKKLHKIERNNTVYDRLCIAGQNLMSVIEQNRGCANKDIAKFTDQILALCEKYKMD